MHGESLWVYSWLPTRHRIWDSPLYSTKFEVGVDHVHSHLLSLNASDALNVA